MHTLGTFKNAKFFFDIVQIRYKYEIPVHGKRNQVILNIFPGY